jgi:hypothetical protein
MEMIIGLKNILGWELLPSFGRYGFVEMIKFLTTETLSFYRLYIGYQYSPFMVISIVSGGSRPIYSCARLKATTSDTCSQYGWPHSLRIGSSV